MGMTFWVHVLKGRKIEGNQNDLSALYNSAEALDRLCTEMRVVKLSSFADHTDLDYNMTAEFGGDDEDEEEPETDPETGWPYGIDDMKWFDVAAGLKTLEALEKRLKTKAGLPDAITKSRSRILEDLADCIAQVKAAPKGGKFHLAVVM
jgi:hypothetical protein